MNKIYIVALAGLQLLVGALASIYVLRTLLGVTVTISIALALVSAIMGLLLGSRNIVKLKRMHK